MRHSLSLVLSCVLSLLVLSACGNAEQGALDDTETAFEISTREAQVYPGTEMKKPRYNPHFYIGDNANEWWVEVYAEAQSVRYELEDGSLHLLSPQTWGSFTANDYVPKGTRIRLHATSANKAQAQSAFFAYLIEQPGQQATQDAAGFVDAAERQDAATGVDMAAAVEPPVDADAGMPTPQYDPHFYINDGANEWWVEVSADAESVRYELEDGSLHPLSPQTWGGFAANDNVPKGTRIRLHATSADGAQGQSAFFAYLIEQPAQQVTQDAAGFADAAESQDSAVGVDVAAADDAGLLDTGSSQSSDDAGSQSPDSSTQDDASLAPDPCPPLTTEHGIEVDGFASDRFTWYEADCRERQAVLVRNDVLDPTGHHGGFMRQFSYELDNGLRRVCDGASERHPGWGYAVTHYNSGADDTLSYNYGGHWRTVLEGQNHAIHEFTIAHSIGGLAVPVTIQWFFANGRRDPVWAITYDTSALAANAVDADTRGPYGDLLWDGGANVDVDGIGWGDHYRFRSLAAPISMVSGFDYSQPNTVPHVIEWSLAGDAEMGAVQTQTMDQHDAGGAWAYSHWGQVVRNSMPDDWNWTFQLNQYELPWGSKSKRLAWGSNYGAVGQTSYSAYGDDKQLSGYPYQSYSVYVVLGQNSANAVDGRISQVETAQHTTLRALVGNVRRSGLGGVGRSDLITYDPAGYNPIYGTWEVEAVDGAAELELTVNSGVLLDPVFVVHNVDASAVPQVLRDGAVLVNGRDCYISLDTAARRLWITLRGEVRATTRLALGVASCTNHCDNSQRDCDETGIDCGGSCSACATGELPNLRGVNLAGADFGEGALPGTFGVHYTYPTHAEVDYFVAKGMNVFRIPFRWERLQRSLFAEFDAAEAARLDDIVAYALSQGAWVLLDPHNYARYFDDVIGTGNVSASAFADFWRRLALRYPDPHVVYGIMNEPHTMSTELWLADTNAAIAAIRATDAANLILVPGNAWTGAHSWTQNWYGSANGEVMLGVVDPLDNYAYEVHQYLNGDSSGATNECTSTTIGSQRISAFTSWLHDNGKRGFLGEFSGGTSATCSAAIDDMLDAIESDPVHWIGWTYWAAGPWWGNSESAIEPMNGQDQPQMDVLEQHLP